MLTVLLWLVLLYVAVVSVALAWGGDLWSWLGYGWIALVIAWLSLVVLRAVMGDP